MPGCPEERGITRSRTPTGLGHRLPLGSLRASVILIREASIGRLRRSPISPSGRRYDRRVTFHRRSLRTLHALQSAAFILGARVTEPIEARLGLRSLITDRSATYHRLTTLAGQYRGSLAATSALSSYEARVFSQNGEDGVIAELVTRLGADSHTFVEFGIGAGEEGNCVLLADVFGWSGVFLEGDPEASLRLTAKYRHNERVATRHAWVTPANIESLLQESAVVEEPDVLSIDLDGNDYWVWEAIRNHQPRIAIVEYNSALEVTSTLAQPYAVERVWDGRSASFGASLGALEHLGHEKGYELVYTDLTGINAFFVRSDLRHLAGVDDVPRRSSNLALRSGAFPTSPDDVFVDVRQAARP